MATFLVQAQDPVLVQLSFEDSLSTHSTEAKPFLIDIDGDGDLDAFVGEDNGNISFFRNIAPAGQAPMFFAQGGADPFGLVDVSGESQVFLVDIDGDDDLDAFVGDTDGDISFYRNTAGPGVDPVFAAPIVNPFGLTNVVEEAKPFFIDIDGDNDIDALVGNDPGDILLFRNTAGTPGDPAFAAAVVNPFGLTNVGVDAAPYFGDIDGDNDIDALIGEEDGNLNFFRNSLGPGPGDPVFAAEGDHSPFGIPNLGLDLGPFLADIDGDGDLDAFVGEQDGQVLFFRNTVAGLPGDPSFRAEGSGTPFGLCDLGAFSAPMLVDIDGDNDLDAFVGREFGVSFFRNIAGPGVDPIFQAEQGDEPFGLTSFDQPTTPFLYDADGDGDIDAFIGIVTGDIIFFRNTAGFGVDPVFVQDAAADPFGLVDAVFWPTPFFVDADGDMDIDAFVGDADGDVAFYRNDAGPGPGDPNFVFEGFNPFGFLGVFEFAHPFFVDVDGDGDLDAFFADDIGFLDFYRNDHGVVPGDPTLFQDLDSNPFGLPEKDFGPHPFFIDIDGDMDIDAFVGDNSGNITFYRNSAGPMTDPVYVAENSESSFGFADVGEDSKPVLLDIDGDGDLDAFVGEEDCIVNFFRNIAPPGADPIYFAEGGDVPFNLFPLGCGVVPAFLDWDGDDDVDAVLGDEFGGVTLFKNIAAPASPPDFAPFPLIFPSDSLDISDFDAAPFIIDIDGDTDPDVFVGSDAGDFYFFRNTVPLFPGDPVFSAEGSLFGLTSPLDGDSSVFVADIDRDGDLDAVTAENNGNFLFFRNSAGMGVEPVWAQALDETPLGLSRVDADGAIFMIDFDGDGDLDAVVGQEEGRLRVFRNVLNQEPAFLLAMGTMVPEDVGPQSFPGAAGDLEDSDGGLDQALTFEVSNDNNALFSVQPAIDPSGTLSFAAAPNAFGSATVTVVLKDDGGTFGGGDDTSDPQQLTITVNPVDDPPVNVLPAVTQMAFQEAAFEFSAANGNQLSVIEVDGDTIRTTLKVDHGTLTAGAGATGNGTSMVTITGPVAGINSALSVVTYVGDPGFSGTDTLTMTTQDLPTPLKTGPSALVAGLMDEDMVDIEVAEVETTVSFVKSVLGAPEQPQIDDTFSYLFELTNTGPVTATNVSVSDPLSPNIEFVSSACATEAAGVVTWNVGALGSGAMTSCDFVVRVVALGLIPNVATVNGGNTAPAEAASPQVGVVDIPTLDQWGLIALMLGLVGLAWRLLSRS